MKIIIYIYLFNFKNVGYNAVCALLIFFNVQVNISIEISVRLYSH